MRILMLNYEYPPLGGGASPVTKSLAEELVTLGHAVDVVTMSFKGLKQREEINGVNIYRVPSIRKSLSVCKTHEMFSYCLYTRRLLPKLLKENNYNLNHTHFIIPTGILSYRLKNKLPYIITSHGSDVPHYNPDRFGLSHRLLKPLWNKIVENAEYIITPSDYLKNIILTNSVFGRECSCSDRNYRKIEVIPNGIEQEEYHFEPHRKQKKILVVSRLFERKGVQYVIEAMKYIEGHTLVICGDGPYKEHLERQIKKLGLDNIHLLGWVNDERLRYEYETASFDLVILSNLLEHTDDVEMVISEAKRVSRDLIYVTFPAKYSLSTLYHYLGIKAYFYGGLDYESILNSFTGFTVLKMRDRILPFNLKNNFSNPEILISHNS